MYLWQGQVGSLYLPPPSSPEAESVVPPSSSLVPVARSGDSAGDGDQHHHHQPGDPLGWLRDAIPGTASGHCVHLPSGFDVSKPTQSENPLQNVHLTYRLCVLFAPDRSVLGIVSQFGLRLGHGGMRPVYR